jgi:hypothetical protein
MPKDGPSAGVTMFTALVSMLKGVRVRHDVAMTGEITLRGRVLPVGGIKEKVLAAHRAGIKRIILPERNKPDLEEVPQEIRDTLEFVPVSRMDEVLSTRRPSPPRRRRSEFSAPCLGVRRVAAARDHVDRRRRAASSRSAHVGRPHRRGRRERGLGRDLRCHRGRRWRRLRLPPSRCSSHRPDHEGRTAFFRSVRRDERPDARRDRRRTTAGSRGDLGAEQIVNQRPVECYARYETGGCADAFVSASGAIATVSGDRRTVLLAQLGSSAVQEISSELPVVAARIDRTGSWLAIESSSPDAPESLLEESSHGSCAGYDCRVPDVVDVISLRSGERRRVAGARRTLLAQWGVVVSARDGATVVREGAVDQISGPCFVEALGFESGLVLARCDGRWEVSQFGELTEIDRGMIAAVAAASSVDAFDDGESRWLSFDFERAARWDASAARWVEVRRGPCPVIALGQDRRALVLAAAIEGGCRGAWLDQYAWTDPIVPDLCQSSDPSHHLGP